MIDSDSKINAMIPTYATKLGLNIRYTDVEAQKIDGFIFETFEIVLANFQIENKRSRAWYF